MKCVNCSRERAPNAGKVIELTEEERNLITMTVGEAPSSYFYCTPCYRILTDREMGARMIAGQLEIRLRASGNPRAQQIAETLYKFLIEKSATKQVS
jgi:hypothetical protein